MIKDSEMGSAHSTEKRSIKFNILAASLAADILEDAEARDEYQETVDESELNRLARKNVVHWDPIDPPSHWNNFLANHKFPEWTVNMEVNIICAPKEAEGGMPHTRPNFIICIPENYSNDSSTFCKMIEHELVHILQRVYYDKFMKFIESEWDYRTIRREEFDKLPEHLLVRRRINPDTFSCPFLIWKDRWIPIIIFNEHIEGPRLKSTYLLWWNIKTMTGSLEPPYVWKEYFGRVPQSEHPFEMMAWYLSDYSLHSDAAESIREKIYSILVRN
jgi:hypothetical protein